MKTQKTRFARFLGLALALTGLFAMAPAASAQYPNQNRDPNRGRRGMRSQSYDRMRQYAQQLDELAREANRQAQSQQAGYRGFRRDANFLRDIAHFARAASQFRARMETYQTQPWAVDDEIGHLLRDARTVEARVQRARFVDRRTVAGWSRTVSLLNQMASEYQAGIGSRGRYPNADIRTDPYPNNGDPRTDPYPNNGDYRGDRNPRSGYGNSTDLRQLAAELDQRAARASQLANGYSGFSSDITHFSEQAREFREQVETNRMSRSEVRSEVNHLLEDAQSAYSELRQRNVTRQVADEWDAIVQILNRMRDLAV
jgi:hypothetical protein